MFTVTYHRIACLNHYLSTSAKQRQAAFRAHLNTSGRNSEHIPSSLASSPKAKMIGDSDRYRPDIVARRRAAHDDEDSPFVPSNKRREPAIGSSSIPFEGDVDDLLHFISQIGSRWSDESWDGLHVAENAKSEGEAEIHDTNGRVRLVVATETTRDDCVALLMAPTAFRGLYTDMYMHRQYKLTRLKICDEMNEVFWESRNLKSELADREKDLLKLQATGPTAAATWRCQRRIDELRVRLDAVERREVALEKLREQESREMTQMAYRVTDTIERVLEEANLLDHIETPPQSYTNSDPVPKARLAERRERYREYREMRSPKKSGVDVENTADFPPLATRPSHAPVESSIIATDALQSAEQHKGGDVVGNDSQDDEL